MDVKMKPIVIIAIAFVLLVPITVFAESHSDYTYPECQELEIEKNRLQSEYKTIPNSEPELKEQAGQKLQVVFDILTEICIDVVPTADDFKSTVGKIIDFNFDKKNYYQFNMITVTGSVVIDPDLSEMYFEIINPEGEKLPTILRTFNPDGTFTILRQAHPDVLTIDGEYTYGITYGNTIEKSFHYQKFRDIAPFVDKTKDPCSYVERYENEPEYEYWFKATYPDYLSIYEAVGIHDNQKSCFTYGMSEAEIQAIEEIEWDCNIHEPQVPTQWQGDAGMNNPQVMDAFREAQSQYMFELQQCENEYNALLEQRITEIETQQEPQEPPRDSDIDGFTPPPEIECGKDTIEKNGQCVVNTSKSTKGGGCLIATATFDSELSPQVQKLREIRDSKLLQTESGSAFMESFNSFYYSFSPYIADYERENPVFKEIVKIGITPMLSSLHLMDYADSESSVLGMGISLIILNGLMYVGIPASVIVVIRRF